ncbi:ankyrin repeat domain-containing protein 27-like [Contarinia nasturtii]|uniref:ankyrin repeat domain-containing protein 27-like n=1 Tax=Contarinia nasturtii TaxID=265458 RepID=UPI0012D45633|nr:ankyrin repeat domain-containing protein 27-like [Contarinia nasturtii]XP_031631907.1 ankyrin repeat domain-containing protein 27-like [Contarinia nasturtii]
MAFQYDEDLSENKFFCKLQREHKILIETAPLENWIVCIPRMATIKPDDLSDTDFLLAHILIQHDEIPEQFTNLLGADVKQINGKLHIRSIASTILFEEIFYTKGLLKYKVWCIEWPLLPRAAINSPDDPPNGIFIVRGLQDAVALIWNETNSKAVFRKIESICCSYMKNTNCTDGGSGSDTSDVLKRIKHSVDILLNHCFKKLMYQRRLYEKCVNDPHFKRVFKIALETYIMDLLYRWLFDAITITCTDENEKFNRTMRNLADASLKDFKIDTKHTDIINRVRIELVKMPVLTTPIEKMCCLRRALTAASQNRHTDISVDELIPILVFVIIKSGLTHWIATMHFLKHFIFTQFTDGSDKGVDSFLITTLEAAILYIQSIDLIEFKNGTTTTGTVAKTDVKLQRRFSTKDDFIDYLFERIKKEDEVEIIKLLKTDKDVIIDGADKENVNNDAHHDNDDAIVKRPTDIDDGIDEGVVDEIDVISKFPECRQNLQNTHGIGPIHVAAMHGLPKMLNSLLALGVNLHIKDENNWSALHYAAGRGHQNTLLLLLHAGAEINALTNDKNTPLHLCALNGHSNCVKALLYYSDHMKVRIDRNAQNKFGDTPLHLASKWGFTEIIDTLLEYGVKTDIPNRMGHTALELAHNSQIATVLQNVASQTEVTSDWEDQSDCSSSSSPNTSLNHEVFRGCFSTGLNHSVDSVSLPQKTYNDKIVAAIKNNDTKLACHFLGIELPNDISEMVCHPLCDCDKCSVLCKHITEYLSQKSTNAQQAIRTYDGDVNVCSTDGINPLHAAVQMKNLDLVERLVNLGAKVGICTKTTHQSAIHLAVLTKSNEILNILLNHLGPVDNGNDLDIQDSNGDTALILAVRLSDINAIDALLKHEPNIQIRNTDRKTATEIAKSLLNLNIMRRLEVAESNDLRNTVSNKKK